MCCDNASREKYNVGLHLSNVRIVLVEPEGADNVGAVCRVMKNFQLSKLVVVSPRCNVTDGRARAMHGMEILETCKVVSSIEAALHGCTRVIASTSRPRDSCTEISLEGPKVLAPWIVPRDLYAEAAVIFGRESSGLSNEELQLAHRYLKIPASEDYPVLNLSMAVGIFCYELFLHACEQNPIKVESPMYCCDEATFENKEHFYRRLELLLLSISFITKESKKKRMMKFRSIFNRLEMSTKEVNMLHGVLSGIQRMLKHNLSSSLPVKQDT
eukprot:jgi/Galph1/1092/GphlegSOOS_G5828.1